MNSMLPLSEASNLAIHALAAINLLGNGRRISVTVLAKVLEVSHSHLAKVMQKLVKAGFVDSSRGAAGGFLFVRNPKKISLFAVIKVMDGELKVKDCLFDHPRCEEGICAISSLHKEIGEITIKRFKDIKITDINVNLKKRDLVKQK
jgi:Rrf2 family protein